MLSVPEIDRLLKQWQMDGRDLHRRLILAPTPRERERWHAIWLLAQGWTASGTAQALGRDSHTIGRWAADPGPLQPGEPIEAPLDKLLSAITFFMRNRAPDLVIILWDSD